MRFFGLVFFLCFSASILAQDLSIDQIVERANEAYRYLGDDVKSTAKMEIKNSDGKTIMTKEMIILRKNTGGLEQKWYAYFKKPADIKKMVFMAWKNDEKDDDRWLYLPALDLVKRLSGSDKRSSFAGSHFAYEDVTGRSYKDDAHELLSTEADHYKIKSIPKDATSVEFSYYESWVDKESFLPTKTILYDKNGSAYKRFDMLSSEVIQGFHTMTKFSMTDLSNGESTVATMSDVSYNNGLPENIFSEAYLRRSPRKYLR